MKNKKTRGQAVLMVLILGTLIAGFIVAYQMSLQRGRKEALQAELRSMGRDESSWAVELANQLLVSKIFIGYKHPTTGQIYYAYDTNKNLGTRLDWNFNKGFVVSAKANPVATMTADICSTAGWNTKTFNDVFITRKQIPCIKNQVNIVFTNAVSGGYLEFSATLPVTLSDRDRDDGTRFSLFSPLEALAREVRMPVTYDAKIPSPYAFTDLEPSCELKAKKVQRDGRRCAEVVLSLGNTNILEEAFIDDKRVDLRAPEKTRRVVCDGDASQLVAGKAHGPGGVGTCTYTMPRTKGMLSE